MPTLVSPDGITVYTYYTAMEFLAMADLVKRADLIWGEIYKHKPTGPQHDRLVDFLNQLLQGFLEQTNPGSKLCRGDLPVKLSARNLFWPDLAWFSSEQAPRLTNTHAPFAPLWICEVLSLRTADRDEDTKFIIYEGHGVKEYWLLDPDKLHHRFYRLEGTLFVKMTEQAGWIESLTIPGFKVQRGWLNPEELPAVGDCLAQMLSKGE